MSYFYNTSTSAIVTYNELKALYPMFSWPVTDNGASVDARLLMTNLHPDIIYYKRLINLSPPSFGRYEKVVRVAPVYLHSQWEWGWEVVPMTSAEILEVDEYLIGQMKDYRDADWSNATVELSNGAILKINDRTRRDVQDTLAGMMTLDIDEYAGWNAENGVYTFTIVIFQEAIAKALLRVKKSFDAYNLVVEAHVAHPYEDDSWMNDFESFKEES